MPYATNRNTKIYWESHGSGPPVLLVMGLGFSLDMWYRVAPQVAGRYRAIIFDNRGVGRTGAPDGPYWIPLMAEDACAVIEAAGEKSVHLLGASMGGMIAQELTLRWPDRVRSLMLGCTSFGGLRVKVPDWRHLQNPARWITKSPEERIRALYRMLYADSTPRERIDEDTRIRLQHYPPAKAYRNQILGILSWSSYSRLPRIHKKTLVVHGEADRLIPVENGRAVARRIPGARFVGIPGAGHVFMTDQPQTAVDLTLGFLDEVAR